MKITSEITGKEYKTVDECLKAEEDYKKLQEEKAANLSKQKKEAADAIEAAEKKLDEANDRYDEVYAECKQKLKEAKLAVINAEQAKLEAIYSFEEKFNKPYQRVYTGEEAEKRTKRIQKTLDDIFNFNWLNLFD